MTSQQFIKNKKAPIGINSQLTNLQNVMKKTISDKDKNVFDTVLTNVVSLFPPTCKIGRIIDLELVRIELDILNSKMNGYKENLLSFIMDKSEETKNILFGLISFVNLINCSCNYSVK